MHASGEFGLSNFLLVFILLFKNNNLFCKSETKFCVSICVHAHTQTKRPTSLKFGTEILEWDFEKSSHRLFQKSI